MTTARVPGDPAWKTCSGAGTQDGTFNVTTTYGYDARGNRTSETAPNGRVTTYVYDDADRLITRVDNDVPGTPSAADQDIATSFAYDEAGRQTAIRAPTSDRTTFVVTRFVYDDAGRVTKEIRNCTSSGTTPPGDPSWKTCTGAGTANATTNVVTEHGYDYRGNRIWTKTPDPSATASGTGTVTSRYAYDTDDRLCRVLENATSHLQALADPCATAVSGTTTTNLSTRYTYDGAGNLASMIDARGKTTTYTYDAAGRMTGLTDAAGKTLAWQYDALGNRTRQTLRTSPGPYVSWSYDWGGRVLTRVADGVTTTYTYDDNGNRLTASDGTLTITAAYDRLNRVISVDDEDAGTTADTTYTYSLTAPSWTDPTGTYLVTLDKYDRTTSIDDPVNSTNFTSTYRADGQLATMAAPNGNMTTHGYDTLGRATTKSTNGTGGVARAVYGWTHNRAGQILSESSVVTGDPTNGTRTYAYDPLARLVSAADATTTTYGWDKVPNRTSVQTGANPAVTTTYDDTNRPVSDSAGGAYGSDHDGRLTARPGQTMTWDTLGRLTQVKNAAGTVTLAAYTYDPLDRLRTVARSGSTIRFRYVGLTTSQAQVVDHGTSAVIRHIGTDWTGGRLFDWTGSGSNLRYYGTNGHHDVTWTADATGAVTNTLRYGAFGETTSTTGSSVPDFRYQGNWFDTTTSLSWIITRWYAPSLGRFISEDTLLGRPVEPDSRHLYAYAEGEPIGRWDPDGRASVSGTFINPGRLRGQIEIGLFIKARHNEAFHGVTTARLDGDGRGFSAGHVRCDPSRGCIKIDLTRGTYSATVNKSCGDWLVSRVLDAWAGYGCNAAFPIRTSPLANTDKWNLVKVSVTQGGRITVTWDLTQSRLFIIRPNLTVNGKLVIHPATSHRGPFIQYSGDGFPSEELIYYTPVGRRVPLIQRGEGDWLAMHELIGNWSTSRSLPTK
ncbi:hypothetical protein BH20CHL7_BH20CHL7_07190 [soil metagenome]